MNKRTLLKAILAALREELQTFTRAANAARAEATDPQSRAENKYDTRGLEASYLAAGQARQVAELESAITAFEMLPARQFAPGEVIGLGALVELEQNGERTLYFIGPSAGGTEAKCGKREVLVITPQSPLGGQLQGRQQGDWLNLTRGVAKQRVQVLSVA
ncbi:MAG: GreA/GreB family elongation factor [Verrucomicrobia bacterium]|nr:GreA/GreB family elongation factor [Verrucomicrobiota bacterium]